MAFPSLFQLLPLLLSSASLSFAAPNPPTTATCTDIAKAIPGKLALPGSPAYIKENKDYFNIGLAELGPACIAFPSTAKEVASIVSLLNLRPEVQFAVKSGGHSPNAGAASTKDGVLIALRNLVGTVLDKEKSLAYIKPGGHWWDVMKYLENTGQTVVSGRLGVVGIGGYLVQGGLSFLSGQYGLAGDVSLDTTKEGLEW